jgi:hypothetical protein
MTEAEWTTCNHPKAMLTFLADSQKASERKLRLFCCACFRRVWHLLSNERARHALEVAERFADGSATDDEREEALAEVPSTRLFGAEAVRWALVAVARTGATMAVDAAGQTAACPPGQEYDPSRWEAEWHGQCDLLRDLFGPLPFRQVLVAPSWRTPHVLEVARDIYDQRTFHRMTDLGQALHQAGCNDRGILRHCVWQKDHTRGCWVLDLLLDGGEGSRS